MLIVIGNPRSGSSAFVREVSNVSGMPFFSEVLNPEVNTRTERVLGENRAPRTLGECIRLIEDARSDNPNNVCKILSVQLSIADGLIDHLLKSDREGIDKVVFFRRRSLIDQALSFMAVYQRGGVWHNCGYVNSSEDRITISNDVMKRSTDNVHFANKWFNKALDRFGLHRDVVFYEDLLDSEGHIDSHKVCHRLEKLKVCKVSWVRGYNLFKKTFKKSYKEMMTNYPQVLRHCNRSNLR
jgi:hypothetical protein